MSKPIKVRLGVYKHYKNKYYKVIGIGRDSESLKPLVFYQALYGKKELWARPLKNFLSKVAVNGKKVTHFEYIKDPQSLTVFVPRPGQVDYRQIRWAPVLNCVLQYKNKFLIVQRSAKMNVYPNAWNGIAGYLDDRKSLKEKIWEEMREECGLKPKDIISMRPGTVFDHEAPQYKGHKPCVSSSLRGSVKTSFSTSLLARQNKKTWVIHPILVKVKTDKIKIDWEAQDYRWVKLNEIKKFKIIPSFGLVVKSLFPKFPFKLK